MRIQMQEKDHFSTRLYIIDPYNKVETRKMSKLEINGYYFMHSKKNCLDAIAKLQLKLDNPICISDVHTLSYYAPLYPLNLSFAFYFPIIVYSLNFFLYIHMVIGNLQNIKKIVNKGFT